MSATEHDGFIVSASTFDATDSRTHGRRHRRRPPVTTRPCIALARCGPAWPTGTSQREPEQLGRCRVPGIAPCLLRSDIHKRPPEHPGDGALELSQRHAPECGGVSEQLSHDGTANLGVRSKLALAEHHRSVETDTEKINRARASLYLPGDDELSLDARKQLRTAGKQCLEG